MIDNGVSLKSKIKQNILVIFILTGLLLSAFHLHSISDVIEHENCAVCHQQGQVLLTTTDLNITHTHVFSNFVQKHLNPRIKTEDFSLNEPRAPPLFLG